MVVGAVKDKIVGQRNLRRLPLVVHAPPIAKLSAINAKIHVDIAIAPSTASESALVFGIATANTNAPHEYMDHL